MTAIEVALARIQKNPDDLSSSVLSSLLVALDTGEAFSFKQLNVLGYKDFTFALEVMSDWRLEQMRVKQGELTSVVRKPENCFSVWSAMRARIFLEVESVSWRPAILRRRLLTDYDHGNATEIARTR